MDILKGLNQEQRDAASDTEGPVLILAGAGSGKTRTLTHRVAYILEQDKAPSERVLVVTFTNRAARELRERLEGLLGDEADRVWAMTFHALCLRILRQSGRVIGIPNQFTVLDVNDTRKLMLEAAKECEDPAAEAPEDLRKIRSLISKAKNAGQGPEALSGPLGERAARIWKLYQEKSTAMGALDFDDLLLKTRELLQTEHGQTNWATRFRYVLVDEYQDVNRVQEDLLQGLCSVSQNICVVGDDSQSVYAFRGAEVEHILSFEKRWPDCTIHKLEANYRSSPAILEAAQAIIERSRHRSDKKLLATLPQGPPVRMLRFQSHWDEAAFVGDRVRQLLADGVQPEEIAVAYRTNAQSQAVEEAFSKRSIDYQVVGGVSFMKRVEIQNSRAYLALLANRQDRLALERATSWPRRGVGPATIKHIVEASAGGDLLDTIERLLDQQKIKGKAAQGLQDFIGVMRSAEQRQDKPLSDLLQKLLVEAGIIKMLRADKQQGADRLANIDGLQELSERYPGPASDTLIEFLADTALDERDEEAAPGVRLMTLHATKGLEFRYVFLVGLEEELFLRGGQVDSRQLEEERRLLYVGMTRAEYELIMSMADVRRLWGREMHTQPLQFLFDLPPSVVHQKAASTRSHRPAERRRGGKRRQDRKPERRRVDPTPPQPSAKDTDPSQRAVNPADFPVGTQVRHPTFGLGTVMISNSDKIEVSFMGRPRTLMPEYARLRRV